MSERLVRRFACSECAAVLVVDDPVVYAFLERAELVQAGAPVRLLEELDLAPVPDCPECGGGGMVELAFEWRQDA